MDLTCEKDCFIFVLSALRAGTHCSGTDNSEVAGRVQAAWKIKFDRLWRVRQQGKQLANFPGRVVIMIFDE